MSHATFLDVTCPHCGYIGPAPLIRKEEAECWLEHFVTVCPECSRGWVIEAGLESAT